MKAKISNLLILFILLTSCGSRGKKVTEEKTNRPLMESIHRTITNDLNKIFSGYILTSNEHFKQGNSEMVQSVKKHLILVIL